MFSVLGTVGTLERQDDSCFVVNVIVGLLPSTALTTPDTDVFFPDERSARTFAKNWDSTPGVAGVMTTDQYDRFIKRCKVKEPCACCGHSRDGHIDRIDASPGQCDTWVEAKELSLT